MPVYIASDYARDESGMLYFSMVADTNAELKAMALNLSIKGSWRQSTSHGSYAYYNYYELDYNKKRMAIVLGAYEMSTKEIRLLKITGSSIYGDGPTNTIYIV